jgi:type II secretory pathway pseudopilin PulG
MNKQYKKYNRKKGFTLLEMIISILLFISFLIVAFQIIFALLSNIREANLVKSIYRDSRLVVDNISNDIKSLKINYDCYSGSDDFLGCNSLNISTNGFVQTLALRNDLMEYNIYYTIEEDEKENKVLKKYIIHKDGTQDVQSLMGKNVGLDEMYFRVLLRCDPYGDECLDNDRQIQPMVSIFIKYKEVFRNNPNFEYNYQTTITSRLYE